MGHIEITRLLLRHNPRPDISFKAYMGYTPLILTASSGHSGILDLLLKDGRLDVAATDDFNEMALCHAVRNGHEKVVMRLYENSGTCFGRKKDDDPSSRAQASISGDHGR
ncbi:hypothetical protein VN97_g11041 [Penicillium thymicola]|uniref:Uncharacterized protein n=1 Tax=Penicillium thymicola TaxID=293382 RepID=A0AAI9T833_PENTH|nr:hypothetical protein VN97_g11041 [Penicillium thymicola]